MPRRALVLSVHNAFEHHVTLVYRTIFLGETLAIAEREGWSATASDTLIDGLTLTDLIGTFSSQPDCILICADVHQSRSARFVASIAKDVSPGSAIFVFGRSTTFVPQYFEREPFDAVHVSGDREVAIAEYLRSFDDPDLRPAGVHLVGSSSTPPGRWSTPDEWCFPLLDALPIEGYRQYVSRTYGSFYSPRISATIGKGCAWGCQYCGATEEEGGVDRRRASGDVVAWALDQSYLKDGFSLHLYHPNLFADAQWIRDFSAACIDVGSPFTWRGVTTTVTLRDPDLVHHAGRAGCTELAIGIESLHMPSGRSAKSSLSAVEQVAANARAANISLKGLVMAGYPGQTAKSLDDARRYLTSLGMMVRFTGYTPLHKLRSLTTKELDSIVIERFDRRTYLDPEALLDGHDYFSRLMRDNSYAFPDEEHT
jgi:hypothetical protein